MNRALSIGVVVVVVVLVVAGVAVYGGFIGGPSATASPVATRTPVLNSPTIRPSVKPSISPSPTLTPSPTPSASSTPVDTNIHASAVVVPVNSADLAMPIGGVVSQIYVHEHDQVIAGQLLLTLDQSKYLSDIDVANASVDQANAAVNSAMVAVDQLPSDATPDQIQAAQAQLRLAQANLELANSQLNAAQAALHQTELRSPIVGTVADIDVNPGESVTAGETIVTIGDMSTWMIETTDVSELDVVRIAVGDQAHITFSALPNVSVDGVVDSIQVRGTTDQGQVTFAVTIRPNVYLPQLRWNMSASVSITPSG